MQFQVLLCRKCHDRCRIGHDLGNNNITRINRRAATRVSLAVNNLTGYLQKHHNSQQNNFIHGSETN